MDRIVAHVDSAPAAPVLGALTAWLLADHHGAPHWFIGLVLTVSLFFGLTAAAAQARDGRDRAEARRLALFNAGALWIAALALTAYLDLHLPQAMILALVLGWVGTPALDWLAQKTLPGAGRRKDS